MALDKCLNVVLSACIASLAIHFVSASRGNGELPGQVADNSIKITSMSAGGKGTCYAGGDCVYNGLCVLINGSCTVPTPLISDPIPHEGGCTRCTGHTSYCAGETGDCDVVFITPCCESTGPCVPDGGSGCICSGASGCAEGGRSSCDG